MLGDELLAEVSTLLDSIGDDDNLLRNALRSCVLAATPGRDAGSSGGRREGP